ncbi:MAG: hypothetical protein ABIF92_00145 [archaeon]
MDFPIKALIILVLGLIGLVVISFIILNMGGESQISIDKFFESIGKALSDFVSSSNAIDADKLKGKI